MSACHATAQVAILMRCIRILAVDVVQERILPKFGCVCVSSALHRRSAPAAAPRRDLLIILKMLLLPLRHLLVQKIEQNDCQYHLAPALNVYNV